MFKKKTRNENLKIKNRKRKAVLKVYFKHVSGAPNRQDNRRVIVHDRQIQHRQQIGSERAAVWTRNNEPP